MKSKTIGLFLFVILSFSQVYAEGQPRAEDPFRPTDVDPSYMFDPSGVEADALKNGTILAAETTFTDGKRYPVKDFSAELGAWKEQGSDRIKDLTLRITCGPKKSAGNGLPVIETCEFLVKSPAGRLSFDFIGAKRNVIVNSFTWRNGPNGRQFFSCSYQPGCPFQIEYTAASAENRTRSIARIRVPN